MKNKNKKGLWILLRPLLKSPFSRSIDWVMVKDHHSSVLFRLKKQVFETKLRLPNCKIILPLFQEEESESFCLWWCPFPFCNIVIGKDQLQQLIIWNFLPYFSSYITSLLACYYLPAKENIFESYEELFIKQSNLLTPSQKLQSQRQHEGCHLSNKRFQKIFLNIHSSTGREHVHYSKWW